jgi:hypothetical protein
MITQVSENKGHVRKGRRSMSVVNESHSVRKLVRGAMVLSASKERNRERSEKFVKQKARKKVESGQP